MTARAIVYPGSFGDATLPKISLSFAPPLANALMDCAVEALPVGPMTSWESTVGDATFRAVEGAPTVSGTGTAKVLRFNGATDRAQATLNISTPHTIVAVFRFGATGGDAQVLTGITGAAEGAIKVTPAGSNVGLVVGSTFMSGNPEITPDTSWHVVVASFAGGASSMRYDDQDITGTLAQSVRTGLTLGHRLGGAPSKQNIEYKRIAGLGRATTARQRSALVSYLKQRYGV